VADESVDRHIVDRLRDDRHQVWYVAEQEPGLDDDAVLARSNSQQAPLLTADKGFGELVYRQQRAMSGVVLARLEGLSPELKAEIVASAVANHGGELIGAFAVVTPGAIRIRPRAQ
jgi:hypothetical protein